MIDDLPPDPDLISLEFPCLRARQPVGDIFVAVINYKDLIRITWFDVRRTLQTERDFERYLGIQRPLDNSRVQKLREYVNFADAAFPTSIIIALEQDYVSFSDDRQFMTVANYKAGESTPTINLRRIARVLDGQHRIAGLGGFEGENFDLTVTVFVGADISDQAQIFATVNLEQTKVNKSLVYDLYELSKSRSPQKTAHNVTVALDRDRRSPLFSRIKRLGLSSSDARFQPITQATFVEGILPNISGNPREDRDKLLRGIKLELPNLDGAYKQPLRGLFVKDKDLDIALIYFNYFSAVAERWPRAWESEQPGWILNRTNGVRALLRFFRTAYLKCATPGDVPTRERFLSRVFSSVGVEDQQLRVDNFIPGTSGEARFVRVLRGDESI